MFISVKPEASSNCLKIQFFKSFACFSFPQKHFAQKPSSTLDVPSEGLLEPLLRPLVGHLSVYVRPFGEKLTSCHIDVADLDRPCVGIDKLGVGGFEQR